MARLTAIANHVQRSVEELAALPAPDRVRFDLAPGEAGETLRRLGTAGLSLDDVLRAAAIAVSQAAEDVPGAHGGVAPSFTKEEFAAEVLALYARYGPKTIVATPTEDFLDVLQLAYERATGRREEGFHRPAQAACRAWVAKAERRTVKNTSST